MDVLIELSQEVGLEPKKVASTGGGEYHCACPKCGGKDRFIIHPNYQAQHCLGSYMCRQCDIKGDTIQFCRDIMGMEWDQALDRCNADIPRNFENNGMDKIFFKPSKTGQVNIPSIEWQKKNRSLIEWAASKIEENSNVMEWLDRRGLSSEAVKRYKIGYSDNPSDKYGSFILPISDFGFPEEINRDGTPKTIWIPRGIVIPTIEPSGAVIRVKVRRSDWNADSEIPKYIAIKGCMSGMNLIGDRKKLVMVVVESELDAYSIHDKIKDFALVVAVGSNNKNPDSFTDYLAKTKPFLLICHDNDSGGLVMLDKWQRMYPNSIAHPTARGKDIGEAFQLGEDLREWILSGLSHKFKNTLKVPT